MIFFTDNYNLAPYRVHMMAVHSIVDKPPRSWPFSSIGIIEKNSNPFINAVLYFINAPRDF